ncbi:ribulose-phosphate 3-epimerase [Candidatus Micrarchaeota archaeon]|nr:ribulose-phosphate 3-epimerase [Candidatus Micrarchaeota archaeon]
MEPEIIPAILVKDRKELLRRINLVKDHVKTIQIDIMDGAFVPNKTIGLQDLKKLPKTHYEFHWMVKDPVNWIKKISGNHMHLVHIETISSFDAVKKTVESVGGNLGLAINPSTPIDKLIPYLDEVQEVLIMTVHPGFSGQKYLHGMESRIKQLRKSHPHLDIEVDGGINAQTIGYAYAAGANLLAAASAIFASDDIPKAIGNLKKSARSRCRA